MDQDQAATRDGKIRRKGRRAVCLTGLFGGSQYAACRKSFVLPMCTISLQIMHGITTDWIRVILVKYFTYACVNRACLNEQRYKSHGNAATSCTSDYLHLHAADHAASLIGLSLIASRRIPDRRTSKLT